MDIKSANIKKIFLLGIAVASTKLVLILFAYFFNAETYNLFNQLYYTASMVILFGSLGFNIAVTRLKISLRLVLAAVFVNVITAYLFLQLISAPFTSLYEIASVIIYALFSSLGGIYSFHLLFKGNYKDYVILTLLYSILHLLIIPFVILLNANIFITLPVVSFLWFVIGYPRYIKQKEESGKILRDFYKIGLSAFIINSAVSLALAADKYFVNHFFPLDIANSYTFAWGITAPMFYIGALVEQFLFSETNTSKTNILRRGFSLSTAFIIIYVIVVLMAINIFPTVVPSSVNYEYVLKIATLMITGYSIYVIFHFPVNAYLFKSLSTEKQKTISIAFAIIIISFMALYILIFREIITINYIWLLVITWSYIFTLLITKIILMFREETGSEPAESVMEIKNLEP
jgi:hypothetical protein